MPPKRMTIAGVPLEFPLEPYDIQVAMVSNLLTAMTRGTHSLIEVPTGCGKTLGFLTATLYWRRHQLQLALLQAAGALQLPARLPTTPTAATAVVAGGLPPPARERSPCLPQRTGSKRRAEEMLQLQDTTGSNNLEGAADLPAASQGQGAGPPPPSPGPHPAPLEMSQATPTKIRRVGRGEPMAVLYEEDEDRNQERVGRSLGAGPSGAISLLPAPRPIPSAAPARTMPAPRGPEIGPTRILIVSRTHSQLRQLSGEHRKLAADVLAGLQMRTLAGRDQMCIEPEFTMLKGTKLVDACKARVYGASDEGEEGQGGTQGEPRNPPPSCTYHANFKAAMNGDDGVALLQGLAPITDIEDVRSFGTAQRICPYFLTKKLAEKADVVLMPYNYLFGLRMSDAVKAMVRGGVVIIDEAHNIESVCRSAMSLTLNVAELKDMFNECATASFYDYKQTMAALVRPVLSLLDNVIDRLEREAAMPMDPPRIFKATDTRRNLCELLRDLGLGASGENVLQFRTAVDSIVNYQAAENAKRVNEEKKRPINGGVFVPSGTLSDILHLIDIIAYMFKGVESDDKPWADPVHLKNYVVIIKTARDAAVPWVPYDPPKKRWAELARAHRQETRRVLEPPAADRQIELQIECLNPAVGFQQLVGPDGARSVNLVSGTLAPLDSFDAELGVPFTQRLNGRHVINSAHQVFARTIRQVRLPGPGGRTVDLNGSMNARKKQQQGADSGADAYFDALGHAVLSILERVPGGVLVALPSYGLLQSLITRWSTPESGCMRRIESVRHVFYEPRNATAEDFQAVMELYTEQVGAADRERDSLAGDGLKLKSAVLFIVCRGRASEGIDFKDAQARAVIAISIPFAAAADPVIEEKQLFNTLRCTDRLAARMSSEQAPSPGVGVAARGTFVQTMDSGPVPPTPGTPRSPAPPGGASPSLISGREWYTLQAFRALNQALGRVIRHVHDYGAIFLLDPRYDEDGYKRKLPAWIRASLKTVMQPDLSFCMQELEAFFARAGARYPHVVPPPAAANLDGAPGPAAAVQGARRALQLQLPPSVPVASSPAVQTEESSRRLHLDVATDPEESEEKPEPELKREPAPRDPEPHVGDPIGLASPARPRLRDDLDVGLDGSTSEQAQA